MSHIPLDQTDTYELLGSEMHTRASPSNETGLQATESLEGHTRAPSKFSSGWKKLVLQMRPFMVSFKALASRFIELSCKPEQLASIILDFWSLSLSIILVERQSGPDLLYPFSSLKKQKSGRLARLLLEHSRDQQLRNIHDASLPRAGVDPPRCSVIDLDEVPPQIIERGYTVPADFYGFVIMAMVLEIFISPILYIFSPIDVSMYYEWLGGWITFLFGEWIGAWFAFITGIIFSGPVIQWANASIVLFFISLYAVVRGEGTLTLVQRSDISTPSCAVLLDRDFTLVLTGSQNLVEAIAEGGFSMSHTPSRRRQLEGWQFGRWLCYEALKASCKGVPFAMLAGFWLVLGPTSLLTAFVPLAPAVVMSLATAYTYSTRLDPQDSEFNEFLKPPARALVTIIFGIGPTLLLILLYELAIVKDPLLRSLLQPTIYLHVLPYVLVFIHFVSSQNCRIRTAKLLDILGPPPVRRWEFDTLAAAATFQCLVLCRGTPRPVRIVNVLNLLDTFVPDDRDVWKVWKARVADRIAHEIDIFFTPTIPSFGDDRQRYLKELLDQAQLGYDEYRRFYDSHVPLYSEDTM